MCNEVYCITAKYIDNSRNNILVSKYGSRYALHENIYHIGSTYC